MTPFSIDDLPPAASALIRRGFGRGATVYVVGGAVRDGHLTRPPEDIDLASPLLAQEVIALLPQVARPQVDETLGVCSFEDAGREIVHTTFRVESGYRADRRPQRVEFVDSPERDSLRRDFTVNALYFDPLGTRILDFHGGLLDLQQRRLRTVGEPRRRFAEDPLRILRAARFETRCGLRPTPACAAAMAEFAPLLANLVPQRRFGELDALLRSEDARIGVERLLDSGALHAIDPRLGVGARSIRARLPTFGISPAADVAGRWRALCDDAATLGAVLRDLQAPRALRKRLAQWPDDPQ